MQIIQEVGVIALNRIRLPTIIISSLVPGILAVELVNILKKGRINKMSKIVYCKEITDSVEIQIHVKIQDRRATTCMGLLNDWRKDI